MTNEITKIDFYRWSGLLSGRIAAIHGARGSVLTMLRKGDTKIFVMERKGEKHTLNADATDEVRLNAHFEGFQEGLRA